MTDKQIITILECCASDENIECCKKCALCEKYDCYSEISRNALNLINRQKAEIEKLKIELQAMRNVANGYKAQNKRLEKELEEGNKIERENELQALEKNKGNAKLFLQAIQHEKSGAIKEFAERLKEHLAGENFNTPDERWRPESEFVAIIDYYVKEMTEVTE